MFTIKSYIKYFEKEIENEKNLMRNYENLIVLYDHLQNREKMEYYNQKILELESEGK